MLTQEESELAFAQDPSHGLGDGPDPSRPRLRAAEVVEQSHAFLPLPTRPMGLLPDSERAVGDEDLEVVGYAYDESGSVVGEHLQRKLPQANAAYGSVVGTSARNLERCMGMSTNHLGRHKAEVEAVVNGADLIHGDAEIAMSRLNAQVEAFSRDTFFNRSHVQEQPDIDTGRDMYAGFNLRLPHSARMRPIEPSQREAHARNVPVQPHAALLGEGRAGGGTRRTKQQTHGDMFGRTLQPDSVISADAVARAAASSQRARASNESAARAADLTGKARVEADPVRASRRLASRPDAAQVDPRATRAVELGGAARARSAAPMQQRQAPGAAALEATRRGAAVEGSSAVRAQAGVPTQQRQVPGATAQETPRWGAAVEGSGAARAGAESPTQQRQAPGAAALDAPRWGAAVEGSGAARAEAESPTQQRQAPGAAALAAPRRGAAVEGAAGRARAEAQAPLRADAHASSVSRAEVLAFGARTRAAVGQLPQQREKGATQHVAAGRVSVGGSMPAAGVHVHSARDAQPTRGHVRPETRGMEARAVGAGEVRVSRKDALCVPSATGSRQAGVQACAVAVGMLSTGRRVDAKSLPPSRAVAPVQQGGVASGLFAPIRAMAGVHLGPDRLSGGPKWEAPALASAGVSERGRCTPIPLR